MPKIKLLVNATSVQSGGAKKRLLAFMNRLNQDDRFEVILLKRFSLSLGLKHTKIISLPPFGTPFFRLLSDFFLVPLLYFLGYRRTYIFGNFFLSFYFGKVVWNITNIEPFVYKDFGITYTGQHRWRLFLLRFLFSISCKPNTLVAQSNSTACLLRKKIKCRVVHVYNGVDIKKNSQCPRPSCVKKNVKYKILFLGQVVRYKRLYELIYYLSASGLFNKIDLSIVGSTTWDDGYFCEICDLIDRLGVSEHISFCGEKSHNESMDMLCRSDALVYTNSYDNCPNVVLEAMSLKIPVLALKNEVMQEFSNRFGGISFFDFKTDSQCFLAMFEMSFDSHFKYSWDDHYSEIMKQLLA